MVVETGRVKWFNAEKGFGFIERQQGEDVFVHSSEIKAAGGQQTLRENDRVTFTATQGQKGWQAESVTVIDAA